MKLWPLAYVVRGASSLTDAMGDERHCWALFVRARGGSAALVLRWSGILAFSASLIALESTMLWRLLG